MSGFFKGLALLVALVSAVWLGMLWHWQATQHEISVRDVAVYLVALPLTLFVLLRLGRWAWRSAAARAAAAPAGVAPAAPGAAAAPAAVGDDEAARHRTLQLLAAHGHTPLGAAADDWAAAAVAHQPAPALDSELRDGLGLPQLCARVTDLDLADLAALDETLQPLLGAAVPRHPGLGLSPALRRALALLQQPLADAVAGLAPWGQALQQPLAQPPLPDGVVRPNLPDQPDPGTTRIHVLVGWPRLNALEAEVATTWLTQQLHSAGNGIVAEGRWMLAPEAPRPEAVDGTGTTSAAISGPQLWLQADALLQARQREGRVEPLLLLAAHSDIDAATVDHLEAAGQLFSSRQPRGTIPGECAAALLLAPAAWPADPLAERPPAHLHRAAVARRDKPIGAAGRHHHELAPQLVHQALAAARVEPAAVAAIANDADQHTPRAAELFGAMLGQLPLLDAGDDMRMLGHLCGSTGACGTLLTVALAARLAQQLERPCLALSVSDPSWRAALVARPAAAPDSMRKAQASSAPAAAG